MKRAFLILGAESTGTRFVTDLLITAGCLGQSTHEQYFDDHPIEGDLIVWRRSFPYFGRNPHLKEMMQKLKDYEVWAVVTTRDMNCACQSNIREGRAEDMTDAMSIYMTAYISIYKQLFDLNIPFFTATYESFIMQKQKYIDWLLNTIKLLSVKYEIKDGNFKYYN